MTKDILVILPHNPGDVVMALQAIGKIKSEWNSFEFDYVVGEECRDLVENCNLIRKSYVIPKATLKDHWNLEHADQAVQEVNKFLFSLAQTNYALSLNLFQEKWGAIIQSFVNAEIKFGLELKEEGNLGITSRILEHLMAIPAYRQGNGWHVVDIYIRAFEEAMGTKGLYKNLNSPPLLWEQKTSKLVQEKNFIALHPGSAWIGKRWPEKKWSQLINQLTDNGSQIVLTGAKEESNYIETILTEVKTENLKSVLNLVGKTTLMDLCEIISQAQLLVTGDTVAMHLAAANQTPVISLFGASNPIETGPYGRGNVILQTDFYFKPNLEFSQKNQGLENLPAEVVAEFIMAGTILENIQAWQTDWDPNKRMQILKNFKQEPWSPTQEGEQLQMVLETLSIDPLAMPSPYLSQTQSKLFSQLEAAIISEGKIITETFLREMEITDQLLAAETETSLIWEAYRIHINGLDMVNILTYLKKKKFRFLLALGEYQMITDSRD